MSEQALNACLKNNSFADALVHCDTLIASGKITPTLKAIKGWCHYRLGDWDEAKKWILEGFSQEPATTRIATLAIAFFMGTADYKRVIELCQQSIAFHPNDRVLWHRLATSHYLLGELDSSVLAFNKALAIEASPLSITGLSMTLLSLGRYAEGFNLYESRFESYPVLDWIKQKSLAMAKWQGESLRGKSILIWTEQGCGDVIQFSRLIKSLAEQGALVDLVLHASHSSLKGIIEPIEGLSTIITVNSKQFTLERAYDFHSPLLSLLGYLHLVPEELPISSPYLYNPNTSLISSDSLLQRMPSKKLSPEKRCKVGVVWETILNDKLRNNFFIEYVSKSKKNVPISIFNRLFQIENVEFFIIQTAVADKDINMINNDSVHDMSADIKTFDDTAAIIESMDAVVSIDTAVAHLAGAMGIPTLTLLPYVADWRWLSHRDDTPWYDNMRLFRQTYQNDWDGVMQRVVPFVEKLTEEFQKSGTLKIQ